MMAWSAQRVLFHCLDPMPPSRALAEAVVVAITSATLVAALLLTWPDDPKWGAFHLRGEQRTNRPADGRPLLAGRR